MKCLALGKYNVQFISKILQWKTKWFRDDSETKPHYSSILYPEYPLIKISETYSTWDDYRKTMEPLIVLECYQSLLEAENDDLKILLRSNINNYQTKNFDGKKFTEFTIKKIMKTGDEYYLPKLGDLLIVKFKNQIEIFGYLENIKRVTLQVNSWGPSIYACYLTVLIEDLDISSNQEIELNSKKSICDYLKMLQALHDLSKSPYVSLILQPDHVDYKTSEAQIEAVHPLLLDQRLNDAQLKIVTGVVKTVEDSKPHICLVQGSQGSGKSTVIISIITELIMKKKNNIKILLCAQSNKAVDAILSKLLNVNNVLKQKGVCLRIIRIFCDDENDPNVRCLSFTVGANGTRNGKPLLFRGKDFYVHRYEQRILDRADVIVSTFSSCYTNKIDYIFGENGYQKIQVCIVDKAEESIEVSNLIPLMFGVKTLVLVGDPQQPPSTIISEVRWKSINYFLYFLLRNNCIFFYFTI